MSTLPPVRVPSIFDVPHVPLNFSPSTLRETWAYSGAASVP
jgi:hypothetical protein